jgi:hypothetical protein
MQLNQEHRHAPCSTRARRHPTTTAELADSSRSARTASTSTWSRNLLANRSSVRLAGCQLRLRYDYLAVTITEHLAAKIHRKANGTEILEETVNEVDEFLTAVMARQVEADTALHNGTPGRGRLCGRRRNQ